MTYEKLLEKFTDYEAHFDQVRDEPKVFAMLRAIVELHSPFKVSWAYGGTYCDQCSVWDMPNTDNLVRYPCPTIQAIEKELK